MALWQRLRLAGLGTIFLVSWAVMIATGCSFVLRQGPSDLRFVKVTLVDLDDAPGHWGHQPGRRVLLVTFATYRDLGADVFETGSITGVRANTCTPGLPPVAIEAMGPYFEDIGLWLLPADEYPAYEALVAKVPKGKPYLYQVFFDYRVDPEQRALTNMPIGIYDLRRDPQVICISIEGNPYFGVGWGVSSNRVVIPKDAIAEALKTGLQ